MTPAEGTAPARIDEIRAPVRKRLERTDAFLQRALQSDSPFIADLTRHIERYKGKRLRPALVHLAALATDAEGGHDADLCVQVAAIVELIHLTTLVHDDVIDEATVRRRVPTVNATWDNETAVMLGDYLFAGAWKALTAMPDARPLAILSATTKLMCEGELLQIEHRGDAGLSEARYLEVIGKKTGELFRASTFLGAMIAGADIPAADRFGRFGYAIGLAFQVVDDLLDLVGTEQQMGKSLGTDIKKGRLTLPAIHCIAQAPASERPGRIERLGLGAAETDRAEVAALLRDSGSIAYASERAQSLVNEALREIADLPDSAAGRSLRLTAGYVLERTV